jgi:hypothetical protein
VWKIFYFLVDFVARNSNNLQKLGLERKINLALNVFTLGPTAQATLVGDKNEFNLLWMKLNIHIELHIHVNRQEKKG